MPADATIVPLRSDIPEAPADVDAGARVTATPHAAAAPNHAPRPTHFARSNTVIASARESGATSVSRSQAMDALSD